MRVLIVRHAIAEETAPSGDDAGRGLTRRGRRLMREAAGGIAGEVHTIDVLACSPLVRAAQTAEILSAAYDGAVKPTRLAALEPGKPVNALLHWLQGQPQDSTLALVGHEPQLGMLISWLLSAEQRSFVKLRKGSACLLEFGGKVKAGAATMRWLLKPSQLRQLGRKR